MPRLPHKVKVDVTKCQARHTKSPWMSPSATPATQTAVAPRGTKHAKRQPSAISATPATQNEGRCHQVPHLPHRMEVDASKYDTCRRHQAQRPPYKVTVDVTKCHTCHSKDGGVTADQPRPSASHEPEPSAISATPAAQSEGGCHQAPRLPYKGPRMSSSARPATQKTAASQRTSRDQARHQSQPSAISATPATQSEARCHQVPRLHTK